MSENRVRFSALLDPQNYLPGLWDLRRDQKVRRYWVEALCANSEHMLEAYRESAGGEVAEACEAAHERFCRFLREFDGRPEQAGAVTVNDLTSERARIYADCGIADPYAALKRSENQRALCALERHAPKVPEEASLRDQLRWAFGLLMAGNFFDMGSAEARRFHETSDEGVYERAGALVSTSWCLDDLDDLTRAVSGRAGRDGKAVLCVDNAGPEIVIGVTALVKVLIGAGFTCVLAANESPSLNDVTAAEARELLPEICERDPEMAAIVSDRRLKVISTGSVTSGLDMRLVSPTFDREASDAGLLVLLGQGRAVETNWSTKLALPWARAAVVKDPVVAAAVGCNLFDPLLTYREP